MSIPFSPPIHWTPGTPGIPPLDQPYYNPPLGASLSRFFRKYATFRGRASRAEFWWAHLFINVGILTLSLGGMILVTVVESQVVSTGMIVVLWIALLGFIVPTASVTVRRLQDTGRSGRFLYLLFVPFGTYIILGLCVMAPTSDGLRFEPYGGTYA